MQLKGHQNHPGNNPGGGGLIGAIGRALGGTDWSGAPDDNGYDAMGNYGGGSSRSGGDGGGSSGGSGRSHQ